MRPLKLQKTELMVVFGCIFISCFCVYATGYRSREQAKQVVCIGHVRLNGQAVISYADDHDGGVTFNYAAFWPHDISYSATDDLMQYGAARQGFYCPSNKVANAFDVRFWQLALISSFPPIPNPHYYSDYDETMLSLAQKQAYYRIISYFFLTDNPSGTRPSFQGTPPRDWIRDLDDITNPEEYEMITDQTMSTSMSGGFYNIRVGGLWTLSQISEQSNHLDKSGLPLGGNIGYVDGHVAWRPFGQMQMRLYMGLYNWW